MSPDNEDDLTKCEALGYRKQPTPLFSFSGCVSLPSTAGPVFSLCGSLSHCRTIVAGVCLSAMVLNFQFSDLAKITKKKRKTYCVVTL